MLFSTLTQSPTACSIGGESHALIERIDGFHPAMRGWSSNRLDASDASDAKVSELKQRFAATLRDRDGQPPSPGMWLVEKTPKNSLRIPFLAAAFPDARFVFLYRPARPTLNSMIEAWQSGHFRTYPRLPRWPGAPWSLLLVPGWEDLRGLPLEEIVAHQWTRTVTTLCADLAALDPSRVVGVDYEAVIAAPDRTIPDLCHQLGLEWDRPLGEALPLSRTVVSAPAADKWRGREAEIERVWPIVAEADDTARRFLRSLSGA